MRGVPGAHDHESVSFVLSWWHTQLTGAAELRRGYAHRQTWDVSGDQLGLKPSLVACGHAMLVRP